LKREIITTADGSKTIHIPEWNEQYHSKHGAIQEAKHVFLKTGLHHFIDQYPKQKEISILEMGFGTGLNALLTYFESIALNKEIKYTGIEAFPVSQEEAQAMEYASQLQEAGALTIYDLVYFDAFGPRVQPSLWTEDLFLKMYKALKPGGVLTTYCAQGAARRAMQSVGFEVERLPGPPGKREMLRASKLL